MQTKQDNLSEYELIEKALQSYLVTTKTSDASGMKNDWFDYAYVTGSIDGNLISVDRDQAIGMISEMGTSPEVKSKFTKIDIQGSAASVRIDSVNWAGFTFTDFFLLVKSNGA